jgi:phytanoyl-CoA hydroxylase
MPHREISDQQAQFFLENGYSIVRDVVIGQELARLQDALGKLTDYGTSEVRNDPDYFYVKGHRTGAKVLRRIEYVIDKRDECKALLGHPFILRSVEKLMGPDFIPTWDSMVLKLPGEGIAVPWHRDAGTAFTGDKPIFNVDFYLDEADEDTCVWLIPGSHKWSNERANEELERRRVFSTEGAIPALMHPGDVLFHNILVLHGSLANCSNKLRRVLYYEFRTAHIENEFGPHIPEYIPLKQKVLLSCIQRRKQCDYAGADEEAFEYRPPAPFDCATLAPGEEPPTYRYPHADFWRE